MPKLSRFITDYIGVFAIGLLVFSLLLAITGFVASYDGRRRLAAFAEEGQTATATITNKHIEDISRNQVYWLYVHNVTRNQIYVLDVSFRSKDGKFRYQSANVEPTTYSLFDVGSTIKLTYVRSNPELFYVANEAPTDQDSTVFASMFHYGTLGSLTLLIFLAAYVFWDREGGGAVAEQTAGTAQSSQGSFRPARPQPRNGFGKRH